MEEISLNYFPIGRQKSIDSASMSAENPIFDGSNFGMDELRFDFNKHVDPKKHLKSAEDTDGDGIFDRALYSRSNGNMTANLWVNIDANGEFTSYNSIEIKEELDGNLTKSRTLSATDDLFTEFSEMVVDEEDGDVIESRTTQYDSQGHVGTTTYTQVSQNYNGNSYEIIDSNSDGIDFSVEITAGLFEGDKRVGAISKTDSNNDGVYEKITRTHVGEDGICEISIEEDTNLNGIIDSKLVETTTNTGSFISSISEADSNEDGVFETRIEKNKNEDGTYTTVAVEDTDLDGIADRTTTIVFDKDLNVLSNDREHTYYALDKQIGNYKQGPTGDCWLLGSLSAIASTQIGKEAIAKSISQDKKGNFIINFEGANKQIKVTQKELIEARESELYSSGDSDVLLLEIAVEKALTPKKNIFQRIFGGKQEESPLHGGNLEDVTRLFFSKGTEVTHGYIDAFNFLDEQYILDNSNYFALATFTPNENGDVVTTDIDGNQVVLAKAPYSHGCAVVRADEDTVTIVNPWDSSKEITISRLNLVHNIDYFEYCQIF